MIPYSTFGQRRGLHLSQKSRVAAHWVIGQPRTGKSRALARWALSDIEIGNGVIFADPHEDGYFLLLKHIALLGQQNESLAEGAVLINPLNRDWAVGINPLELTNSMSVEKLAAYFKSIALKIWRLDSTQAPRMSWLMTHTFMALSELGLTLVELPTFLRDHQWRNKVVEKLSNSEVKEYFQKEFPTNEKLRLEWMQSTINKMGEFVLDSDMRAMLGQRRSTVNFRELMDSRNVVLMNLAKGRLGTENSHLFGAFLVGMIQQAALERADTSDSSRRVESSARPDCFLYMDEFQNFVTDHIHEILSESPKYGLRLIVAHQYLGQLPEDLRQAIMNTYGILTAFRVGYQDAKELVYELFLPAEQRWAGWQFKQLGPVPLILPKSKYSSLDREIEYCIRNLTNLSPREFWVVVKADGGRSGRAIKQRTLDMPDPVCPPEIVDSLVVLSGIRHARRKESVIRELERERPQLLLELGDGTGPTTGWDYQ